MTAPRLGEPIVTDGSRSINFFNGRLLSAEDLRTEQDFEAAARRRLGLGVGDGVVTGLVVRRGSASSATRPYVSVLRGHAINRHGDVVTLPVDVDVDLTAVTAIGVPSDTPFGPCTGVGPAGPLLGTGVYLLVVRPAGERRGRAPTSGLDADPACAADAVVEGAAFGLVPLDLPTAVLGDDQRPLLRSRVAHLLLGTADPRRIPDRDPLAAPEVARWGLLDDLRAAGKLDDACVPIAVLSWAVRRGIEFVDSWAARRRPVRPVAGLRWPTLLGDRVRAEAEAAQHQFQDHVDDVVAAGGDLSGRAARDLFAFLPAVGAVPVGFRDGDTTAFDASTFLGSHGSRHADTLDGDQLAALLADGLLHRPVAPDGPASRFRRYLVIENLAAVTAGADVPLAMVFAAEGVTRRGTSRFGLAITGASTFAATVDVPRED